MQLVYEKLRKLAAQKLADEKPGQTLQSDIIFSPRGVAAGGLYAQDNFAALRSAGRAGAVFLKAGEHKVIGMGSAARLRMSPISLQHKYEMTSYAELHKTLVDGTHEHAGFFDLENGGKVRGGERRKEKLLMSFIGVDDAGHPRADDQIKLHFDQDDWNNPAIYSKNFVCRPELYR